jgi:hypothetical protein
MRGHSTDSLARRGSDPHPLVVAALAALALAMLLAFGFDDAADLAAHDQWMAQVKEEGAWVMW